MYREPWIEDILRGRSLLQCALDVHMTVTGSFDRDYREQMSDFFVLCHALRNWQPGSDRSERFDNSVKTVIQESVMEVITLSDDRFRNWAYRYVIGNHVPVPGIEIQPYED